MDINASIDVGKNITSLIERLAAQIGTTADKVFPWYVQQAQIEGWTSLCAAGIFLLVFGIPFLMFVGKPMFHERAGHPLPAFFVSMICGFGLLFTLLLGGIGSFEAVRKIHNPNYYAMKMMTRDAHGLV